MPFLPDPFLLLTWPDSETFPEWFPWPPLFNALTAFLEVLSLPGIDARSERFQAIQFREALAIQLPSLNQAGIANQFDSSPDLGGSVLVASVLNDISSILTDLDC